MQGKIIDTTLREGEQTPGVTFTFEQKKKITDSLAKIGVAEVEVGISSPQATCSKSIIDYCRTIHPSLRLSLWGRCREEDINYAAEICPDILSLSIPVSDIHLQKKFNRDRHWARLNMVKGIALAKRYGMAVSIGFEDATRSDIDFLMEMAVLAEQSGVERIRLADTIGTASPGGIAELVSTIKNTLTSCQLGVHTHNDFGMATANAIAAFEHGAHWADGVVLGLGERAGCARLEELVGYLALVKNDTTIHPEHLQKLALYISTIAGKNIDKQHPLVGSSIFTCETGLHLQGLLAEPMTYEPYSPQRLGRVRHLILGKKSGRKAYRQLQSLAGMTAADTIILDYRDKSEIVCQPAVRCPI